MPQIAKIRIVNFQYNDGNRLIADELYNFENEDQKPSDTLINLANGGGKSVLVQLMMQPIIPRAKVAGRRIESFFTKATDHCYVVAEWAKDGSRERLLTGIAMAASDSSADTDSDRGFQIKYYTFLSEYQDDRSNYTITTLPLSQKENGRFIPAAFDEVRNLAKKSGGRLERYSSDDSVRWRERLAQFGIVQNEWHMTEKLNSNEDGLSQFFASLKTSDAVIDELILPRIEEKQSHSTSKDDSSLETMLLSYAKQFSRQQDTIRERDILAGFLEMLAGAKESAEGLWTSNDSMEKCIAALFAYADALEAKIEEQNQEEKRLEKELTDFDETIRHIRWEKVSDDFYTREEELKEKSAEHEAAERAKTKAKDKLEEAKMQVRLLECARYYRQLREKESRLLEIIEAIAEKENNTESANRLASLKYSAYLAIQAELERIAPQLEELLKEKVDIEQCIEELETSITSLQQKIDAGKTAVTKAETKLESQINDNNDMVERLSIETFRMLDGRYPADELERWRSDTQKEEQSVIAAIEAVNNEIVQLEMRREKIPEEIADVKTKAKELQLSLRKANDELAEYHSIEGNLRSLYQKYGLDDALRFTDHAANYLSEQRAQNDAYIEAELRKIEATEEAIAAVRRGTLHIPKLLSEYLDSTGVYYTSVEQYILAQKEKTLLTDEACTNFLERYPFAAYGVIVDSADDRNTVCIESNNQWLPALLPIFTKEDIEAMLQGEERSFASIAAYSKEYFLDSAAYAAVLQDELCEHMERKSTLEERRKTFDADAAIVKTFAAYDMDWEQKKLDEIKGLDASARITKEQLDGLLTDQTEIKENISSKRKEEKSYSSELSRIQGLLADYERLIVRLQTETALRIELENAEKRLYECQNLQNQKLEEQSEKDTRFRKIQNGLEALNAENCNLRKGLETVAGAEETPIVAGEWRLLLERYSALLSAQNDDLKRLNEDRERLLTDIDDKKKEIRRRNCEQEEYENLIYTEALEAEANREKEAADAEAQIAFDNFQKVNFVYANAKSAYDAVAERLKEFGGEPLPLSEVGKAFNERIATAENKKAGINFAITAVKDNLSKLYKIQGKTENEVERHSRPAKYSAITLELDCESQLNWIIKQIGVCTEKVAKGKRVLNRIFEEMSSAYGSESTDVRLAISSMQALLTASGKEMHGDRYYTLYEHIDANKHTAELRISQIETDLMEFSRTKDDLVRQCLIQGQQMYEGLMKLANNSKVKVQGKRRQMLKFDIPDAVDENIARASIAAEIEKGTQEIVAKATGNDGIESEMRRIAARTVGSKRLLRKFIGAENIVLRAYKIDQNPDNSGYRTWEQTQVNNSGAEKFVVYFAVILALMAYTRDDAMDIKDNRSVLILDNPFGPISSRHVLEPMFEISRNYNVQMICLSDISKSDIVSCFSVVIRAVVKKFALSSREQLTHEGNELIEHGFYRSEQTTLF